MVRAEFENYGIRAKSGVIPTEMAGRYPSQVDSEREILVDVIKKLDITPSDRLLEIGCGPGQILIPLSFLVCEATGVDHPEVCSVFEKRFRSSNLTLVSGNFMDVNLTDKYFDKILCYSVVSTLPAAELDNFVVKALSLIKPGGKMLIGDIANIDKKSRFLNSETGKAFDKEWRERDLSSTNLESSKYLIDKNLLVPTDEIVLSLVRLVRDMGYHCYVLPQPETLPWGNSREDLLIARPQ